MAIFEIKAWDPSDQKHKKFSYDTEVNIISDHSGENIFLDSVTTPTKQVAKIVSGKGDLKIIKIQLGLSCNFSCEYCNQRFVPHADSTNPEDVSPFVNNMKTWFDGGPDGSGKGTRIELWGGEPFVYWKTMKPLVEEIFKKYPEVEFSVITNGSLLDQEKILWLDKYNFSISVSHDGPGQFVRGPDPLQDPESKEAIIQTYKKFAPKGKFSFNAMINAKNISRASIEEYFIKFISENISHEYTQHLVIGEGTFVDAYDEGGAQNSLLDEEQEVQFRNLSLSEYRTGKVTKFITSHDKVTDFIKSVATGVRLDSVTQKCGMDKKENIAVDLNGNVLTCQNVSAVSTNPSGISHLVGNVSDLNNVNLKTSTHLSEREECPKCPVVHICKGACMFLTGDLWEISCNNAFSDNIVAFSVAFEQMTGCIPEYIDGPLRQDRKDIYWWTHGKPETKRKNKVIPILAA
jgi:uncharacterized protein